MTSKTTDPGRLTRIECLSIEELRALAMAHGEVQFVHLCTQALTAIAGEHWAVYQIRTVLDLIRTGLRMLARERSMPERDQLVPGDTPEALQLRVIRMTDTTRPDSDDGPSIRVEEHEVEQ